MKFVSQIGRLGLLIGLTVASLALFACSNGEDPVTPSPAPEPAQPAKAPATPDSAGPDAAPTEESPEELATRGRAVYMSNCIACHNMDPKLDGALGPAVEGSSRDLLEARIMRAAYPAGHTPKRDSKVMIALPYLSNDIDALTAYLNP